MSLSFILSAVLLCIVSYLMGSVSTAILVCRALGYPDPRSEGSNNPGATNVLRIAGKGPALLTLAGDVGKGILAILLGRVLSVDEFTLALMGLAAFIGHLFPLYFNFEGGKGVATALGVITTLAWPIGLGIMLIWLIVAVLSRYSSLAALVSWTLAPLLVYLYQPVLFYPVLIMAILLIARHQTNIKKLWAGTESRIGDKKQAP